MTMETINSTLINFLTGFLAYVTTCRNYNNVLVTQSMTIKVCRYNMVIFSGTQSDVKVLKHFFENTLHFEVNEAHDLTYDDLIKTFEAVKRRLNDVIAKDNIYCFLCAILSHGNLVSIERGIALSVRQIFKMHLSIFWPPGGGAAYTGL